MPLKIAAITMARNDLFFLSRWIEYYGRELGKEHLYITLDGEDQELPHNHEGTNIKKLPHHALSRAKGDKYRIGVLSELAKKLFNQGYDRVIGTDADEFIIVDPKLGISLKEYLSRTRITSSLSPLGLDLGQRRQEEPAPLDPTQSLLVQRRYAVLSPRYTKASILTRPLRWGSGFHRVKGHNFHIVSDLYLIHTGYCDLEIIAKRAGDTTRIDAGWEAHLGRRARTVALTTHANSIDGDLIFKRARRLQTIFRPIFALNKPMMPYSAPKVVRLPERFSEIKI
ncbi:MAG: glycosyltransferase family 2 protein [Bacteroidales bacterium]|uniref:glycosyltransferase family 2 protein n=1 Tax=Porphyromonas sp. TaxID=1924944 RepID=UPI002971FA20|nr:glycosyltransferase family 2 protein [Porphyromonas sp.]MDD7438031.1 glycosyltransferase family 2 protein [Bacteroidales bacterium]MDY3067813.1 glycosyltransferase family 2 protein [Porphyromonas sp.]